MIADQTPGCKSLSPLALWHATQPTPLLPEAPCSVNLFFEVQGYGKAQATGRGTTPQEAVANLQGTIQATRAALATRAAIETPPAPPAPPSREAQLATLLTCGIQRALSKGDMGLIERLSKAMVLVLSDAVTPGMHEATWTVRSEANSDTSYEVSHGGACTCKDWKHRNKTGESTYRCKHILAVLFTERLGSQA